MSAMISDLTMKPPRVVELASKLASGSVLSHQASEGKSISHQHGHSEKRNLCSNLIKDFYGYQTLIARRSRTVHSPCWEDEKK